MDWLSKIFAKCISLCSVFGGVAGFLCFGTAGIMKGTLLAAAVGTALGIASIFSFATVCLVGQYLASSRPRSFRSQQKSSSQAYRERRFFL